VAIVEIVVWTLHLFPVGFIPHDRIGIDVRQPDLLTHLAGRSDQEPAALLRILRLGVLDQRARDRFRDAEFEHSSLRMGNAGRIPSGCEAPLRPRSRASLRDRPLPHPPRETAPRARPTPRAGPPSLPVGTR